MATLDIMLFGTLRVQRAGQPVLQFPTRRVKELFSLLLLSRHTLHSREVLADTLWGDGEERDPRHCLNTALWRLRRVLGEPEPGDHPYLRVDAQRIGFNTASDCRIDVAEFESRCLWADQLGTATPAAPDQQAAFYRQAVGLYRADLLVDCYTDWCLAERNRLQCMYLRALDFLVGYHAARHEYAEATEFATRLLACDPLREDIHQQLIRFYLDAMQPALALRQFQTCAEILQRELGTAPAPETRAIVQSVFARSGSGAPASDEAKSAFPVGSATAPTADDDLTAVLERLRQAIDVVESARVELRAAASSVETFALQLAERARGSGEAPPDHVSRTALGQNAALLARGVAHLEYLNASASGG